MKKLILVNFNDYLGDNAIMVWILLQINKTIINVEIWALSNNKLLFQSILGDQYKEFNFIYFDKNDELKKNYKNAIKNNRNEINAIIQFTGTEFKGFYPVLFGIKNYALYSSNDIKFKLYFWLHLWRHSIWVPNINYTKNILKIIKKIYNIEASNNREFKKKYQKKEKQYSIMLGSSIPLKIVNPMIYAKFANFLYEKYEYVPTLIGGAIDAKNLRIFIKYYNYKYENKIGCKLDRTIDIIASSQFILTNDTFAFHVAQIFDTKKAIFINKDYKLRTKIWYPYEKNDLVIRLPNDFFMSSTLGAIWNQDLYCGTIKEIDSWLKSEGILDNFKK